MLLLRRPAQRDDGRMLDEQQHVLRRSPRLIRARATLALELERLGVAQQAQVGRPRAPALSSARHPTSRVDHPAERIERRLGDRLGQRRMRVDRQIDFFDRELVLARDDELVDQLRRVRADDVRAEDLAVLRVANDLHEAFRLARRARAAVRREGELADLVVELLLLALLLGEADRRDFRDGSRSRSGCCRSSRRARALAGEQLGDDDAFALALVREHRRAGDVADGVDALARSSPSAR